MIRPFLLTAGSRGDVEPLMALSSVLSTSTNVELTTLCLPSDYTNMAPLPSDRFAVVPLKFSITRALDYIPAFRSDVEKSSTASRKPEEESKMMGLALRDLIIPDTKRVYSVAVSSKSTIVLTTFITYPIAQIISEKLNIPIVMLQLQPIVPTRFYPNIMLNAEKAAAAVHALHEGDLITYNSEKNLDTYFNFAQGFILPFIEDLNKERSDFNLTPITVEQIVGMTSNPSIHEFVAVQSQLIPRAPDMPDNVHIVGSLATSFIPASWNPEKSQQELSIFLRSGPPPVVVSYGSMESQGAATGLMRALLNGMIRADVQRVVIVPGMADLGLHHLDKEEDKQLLQWAKGHVFVTSGNVQYSWLLPQCEMFFSHCGAGSTSAALHAGIPVLGTPLIADQMFFAELIKKRNLGGRVGTNGLPSVDEESVFQGIMHVRTDAVRKAVRTFADEQKRLDENVEKVCQLIERIATGTVGNV